MSIYRKRNINYCFDPGYWRSQKFCWEGPKMKKFCDVILVTFFGDVKTMTSLK